MFLSSLSALSNSTLLTWPNEALQRWAPPVSSHAIVFLALITSREILSIKWNHHGFIGRLIASKFYPGPWLATFETGGIEWRIRACNCFKLWLKAYHNLGIRIGVLWASSWMYRRTSRERPLLNLYYVSTFALHYLAYMFSCGSTWQLGRAFSLYSDRRQDWWEVIPRWVRSRSGYTMWIGG